MLYEEFEAGVGENATDEWYKATEKIYMEMPNSFSKKQAYALALALGEEHTKALANLVEATGIRISALEDEISELRRKHADQTTKASYFENVIDSLENEGIEVMEQFYKIVADNAVADAKRVHQYVVDLRVRED